LLTSGPVGFSDMLFKLKDLNDEDGLLDGIANDSVDIALMELTEASDIWGRVEKLATNYKEYCIIDVMGAEESKAFIQQATAGIMA
jgi:hypothetical protein